MLAVRLNEKTEKLLGIYSKKNKLTKSELVKEALDDYLQKQINEEAHEKLTLIGIQEMEDGKLIPEKVVRKFLSEW